MIKREKGFTLVEVVASIVIIGIVLLGAAQLMIQSNHSASINNEKLVAIDLADTVLQRLKAESYIVEHAKGSSDEVSITLPDDLMTDLKTDTFDIDGTVKECTVVKFNDEQYYELRVFGSQGPKYTDPSDSKDKPLNIVKVRVEAQRVKVENDKLHFLKGKSVIEGYVEL